MPSMTGRRSMFSKLAAWRSRNDHRPEAVEALHAHAGLIISSAARVLGSLADAEDIAQDLAEKLLRSPPTAVRSWPALLKTMAVNAAVDQLRRRRDWSDLPESDGTPDPEHRLTQLQQAELLRAALSGLSERDSLLFSLHYLADLSQVEIADQLEMTPNAVGVAIHRLRQRLTTDVRQRLGLKESGDITS